MTPQLLLEALRRHIRERPPLEGRGPYSDEQHEWLGRASALIRAWNPAEAVGFGIVARNLASSLDRPGGTGRLVATMYEAVAHIESTIPVGATGAVFGPGAVYDFFNSLQELIGSAERSLFIVDPYLDASVFDAYLSSRRSGVASRLLVSRYADNVKAASTAFVAQHGGDLEVRASSEIHDRVVFVDRGGCWVLGASIKDAAVKKPTYLAPLSPELAEAKLAIYEQAWSSANAI
jgi:hypothetical protein